MSAQRRYYSVPTFGGVRRVVRARGSKLDEFPYDIRLVPNPRPVRPRRRTSTRRRARAARGGDPRARRLRALRVIVGNPKKISRLSQIKHDEKMGTSITAEEIEHVAALLEDGYSVLLVPLGDQVVIAMVDLERLSRLIGEIPHELRH